MRKRKITRTMTVTTAQCVVANKETAESSMIDKQIIGDYNKDEAYKVLANSDAFGEDFVLLRVEEVESETAIYSLPEATFFSLATKREVR